jgi:hypothetical protein
MLGRIKTGRVDGVAFDFKRVFTFGPLIAKSADIDIDVGQFRKFASQILYVHAGTTVITRRVFVCVDESIHR